MFIQGITQDTQVYLNGEFLPLSQAKISVLDRGFIFGDGIYEVVPAYHRKPFRLEHHVARLMRSLKAVGLETGKSAQYWSDLMVDMVNRAPWDESFVYLQITRGVAKRDHEFPHPPVEPTVFAMASERHDPSAHDREQGLRTVRMDDLRWLHCDIKTVSLLGNVLAKQYAKDHGVDDVIQFRNGFLTEASAANIWVVKNGQVLAPQKDNRILEGIRYGVLQELCEQCGIAFQIRDVAEHEVDNADELMITAATKEVLPITQHNGKPVGTGQAGPVYKRIRQAYDDMLTALKAS